MPLLNEPFDWSQVTSGTVFVLLLLALLLIVFITWRVMQDTRNDLECWQFIASKGADGKQYADIDKLGKVVGMFVGSWVCVKIAQDGKMDAFILGTYFAFVGGVAGYSAYLRSKQNGNGDKPQLQEKK